MSTQISLVGKEFLIDENLLITNVNPFDSRNPEYKNKELLKDTKEVNGTIYLFPKAYYNEPTPNEFKEIKTITDATNELTEFNGSRIEQFNTTFTLSYDGIKKVNFTYINTKYIPTFNGSTPKDFNEFFVIISFVQINNIKTYADIPTQELLWLIPSSLCGIIGIDGIVDPTKIIEISLEANDTYKRFNPTYIKTMYANTPQVEEYFGVRIAGNSKYIYIGAHHNNDKGTQAGKVEIFNRDGIYIKTIYSNQPGAVDYFGAALACNETHLYIGSQLDDDKASDAGKVEMFTVDGAYIKTIYSGTETTRQYVNFGASLVVGATNLYVGVSGNNALGAAVGKVEIFTLDGTFVSSFYGKSPITYDYFGLAIGCSDTNIFVGSYGDDDKGSNAGKVEIFTLDGTYVKTIYAENPLPGECFGVRLFLYKNYLFINAHKNTDKGIDTGKVEVFKIGTNGTDTTYIKTMYGNNPTIYSNYGVGLFAYDDILYIASHAADDKGTDSGKVEVYNIYETTTTEFDTPNLQMGYVKTIQSPTPAASDYFGVSMARNSNYFAVGSHGDDDKGINAGKVEIFTLNGAYVKTIYSTTPSASGFFGTGIGMSETHIAIAASISGGINGRIEIFTIDGIYVRTIKSQLPNAATVTTYFGRGVAMYNDIIVVGSYSYNLKGAVEVFNIDGTYIRTIYSQSDAEGTGFGVGVGIDVDYITIGTTYNGPNNTGSGFMEFYDHDGNYIKTLMNPDPLSIGFSYHCTYDNFLLIGNTGNSDYGINSGRLYIFEKDSLKLIKTIYPTQPAANNVFGTSCIMTNENIYVAGFGTNNNTGKVEMFRYSIDDEIIEEEIKTLEFKKFHPTRKDLYPNKMNYRLKEELYKDLLVRQPLIQNEFVYTFTYNNRQIEVKDVINPIMVSDKDINFIRYISLLMQETNLTKYLEFCNFPAEINLMSKILYINKIIFNILLDKDFMELNEIIINEYLVEEVIDQTETTLLIPENLNMVLNSLCSNKIDTILQNDYIFPNYPKYEKIEYNKNESNYKAIFIPQNHQGQFGHNKTTNFIPKMTYSESKRQMGLMPTNMDFDYYIATDGNNTNDGLTRFSAKADFITIPEGSKVLILAGTYTGTINIDAYSDVPRVFNGASSKNYDIYGEGSKTLIIRNGYGVRDFPSLPNHFGGSVSNINFNIQANSRVNYSVSVIRAPYKAIINNCNFEFNGNNYSNIYTGTCVYNNCTWNNGNKLPNYNAEFIETNNIIKNTLPIFIDSTANDIKMEPAYTLIPISTDDTNTIQLNYNKNITMIKDFDFKL